MDFIIEFSHRLVCKLEVEMDLVSVSKFVIN